MPDLLKLPAPSKETIPRVLHAHHDWRRFKVAVLVAVVGLAFALAAVWICHPSWHEPKSWHGLALIWSGSLVLTFLLAVIGWRYASSWSLLQTAQTMDRDLATKNRLEAVAALRNASSPLGRAQLEETQAYLEREPRVRRPRFFPWLLAAFAGLLLLHVATFLLWVVPGWFQVIPPPPPARPQPLPVATIIWKSPEPETKANPIEEVPTQAVAQSSTGLRNLSLEISVNGTPTKSIAIPAKPYDQPGENTIKASLFMDDLGVQPFDVVSYYLRGQRVTNQKVPDTTSEIQFIEVRRFRDDAGQEDGYSTKAYDLLIRLKLAQLRSIKENFILAHTDLSKTDPVRVKENTRVGKNQPDLSAKTEEVVQAFILDGVSADIIDLLRQAEPFMSDAGKKILATNNDEAMSPQQKALSLIVEVEKFFRKSMGKPKGGPVSSNPDDPFKDKQQHELKKRSNTAAGQIEQLAKNQASLSHDLSQGEPNPPSPAPSPTDQAPAPGQPAPGSPAPGSPAPEPTASTPPTDQPAPQAVDPFGADANKGTPAERQTRVLQGVEALLNNNTVLPATVMQDLEQAKKDASGSLHRLDAADAPGAREPAAQAASDLQKAIADMNEAGDKATQAAMQAAQDRLNDAARQLDGMANHHVPPQPGQLAKMADQLHATRKDLEKAADQQQEAGSGKDAQRLQDLAKNIQAQGVQDDLQKMNQSGLDAVKAQDDETKLENLAQEAALAGGPDKPSAHDLANLIQSLERSRANLAHLAEKTGSDHTAPPAMAGGPQQPPLGNASDQTPPMGPKNQDQAGTPGPKGPQDEGPQATKDQAQKGAPIQTPDQGQGPPRTAQNPTAQQGEQGDKGSKGQSPQASAKAGQNPSENPSRKEEPTAQTSTTGTPSPNPGNQHGGTTPAENAPAGGNYAALNSASQELTQDLTNELQRASLVLPNGGPETILRKVQQSEDVVRAYQSIAPPLDQLIVDLKALEAHLQRQELVKAPDLDQAPPAYRPAVSDYFESMSRDYHPPEGNGDTSKP